MGNAKSKSSKYDTYSGKGPPTRSNSDPSSIYFASQFQQLNSKELKKHSKKSKKNGKSLIRGKGSHGSSNSISLPSTSSSLTMMNDPKGEVIMARSSNNNYSRSTHHSSNTSYPSSTINNYKSSSSSKPGSYLDLEEEFKKLDINLDMDLTSSLNPSYSSESLRRQKYTGKNKTSVSEGKKSHHSHSEATGYKTSVSSRNDDVLSKPSYDDLKKNSKHNIDNYSSHSNEDLKKNSKHNIDNYSSHSNEDLKKSTKLSHESSKKSLNKSSNGSMRKSPKDIILEEDESFSYSPRKSLPVPSAVELNRLSKDVMDALALPTDSRDFINSLPNSQKWELIQKYYNANGNDSAEIYCISYTQRLKENPFDKEIISDIATALHTHIVSDIIDKFINYGGLHLLLSNLKQLEEDDKDYGPNYDEIESLYIQCIKAIMNHGSGLENMMDEPKSIIVIALCLRSSSLRTRCLASEILAAVCMIPKGHNYVLQALTDFKDIAGETKRFETIVRGLILDRRRRYKNETVDRDLQLASLSLINAMISGGSSKLSIEFRTHLRFEFTNLGILEIFDKLKTLNDNLINNQIKIFETSANSDEEELYKRFNCNSSDSDAVLLFESLNNSMKDTRCYKYFIDMLKHSLLMPKDSGERTAMWMLIDQLTQNIVLKNNDQQSDPQASILDINVERVINDIKTMETVLNKQAETSPSLSTPTRSSSARPITHSYSQKRKMQQNKRKSLNRRISFDAVNISHSNDPSINDISARNSIKRRSTAFSKKKKHISYGKKAKYVS